MACCRFGTGKRRHSLLENHTNSVMRITQAGVRRLTANGFLYAYVIRLVRQVAHPAISPPDPAFRSGSAFAAHAQCPIDVFPGACSTAESRGRSSMRCIADLFHPHGDRLRTSERRGCPSAHSWAQDSVTNQVSSSRSRARLLFTEWINKAAGKTNIKPENYAKRPTAKRSLAAPTALLACIWPCSHSMQCNFLSRCLL
jgi:hypothetical protein